MLELSATEFEVVWASFGLGDLPLIFRVRVAREGQTDDERARHVRETVEGMRARGLFTDDGPHHDLADAVAILASPEWLVDARLETNRSLCALGAAAMGRSAIAVLEGDTVTILLGTAFGLVDDMAALAADHPPGPGASINLSWQVLVDAATAAGDPDPQRVEDALVERGVGANEARMLGRLSGGLVGSGQYGVEVADRDAGLRRAPRVVGFVDTPDGRWAQLRTAGLGGTEWVTFTPATPHRIAAMITDVLAESGVRPG